MAKSLFNQLVQIRGTNTFFDNMYCEYAEQIGRHYTSGTVSTVSGSTTITDNSSSFIESEKNNYIVIDSGFAAGIYEIISISGSNATVTPAVGGTDSAASARRHYYQNIEDDLNYVRKIIRSVTGEDNWYDFPSSNLQNTISDTYSTVTNGTISCTASGSDTLTINGSGSIVVGVDADINVITISGAIAQSFSANLTRHASGAYWYYEGGFSTVPSDLIVHLNGLMNKEDDSDYYTTTVVSGELRVAFNYSTYDTDWVNCQWGAVWSGNRWIEIAFNANISAGQKIIIDTSSVGQYILTLPANPQKGDEIWFIDGGYNCSTVNVTINRSGNNIMGLASNLDVDTDGASFSLIYYNTSRGWIIR